MGVNPCSQQISKCNLNASKGTYPIFASDVKRINPRWH